MNKERLILVSALILFLFLGFILALPNLNFLFPTVPDTGYSKVDSITINVSINNSIPNSVWLDWNYSLIGYWSMDYYNDTGVFDNSSYGNFGEFNGNVSSANISSGIRGNALDFDGEKSCVYYTPINLEENSNISVFGWVNPRDADGTGYEAPFGRLDGNMDVYFYKNSGNNGIRLSIYSGSYQCLNGVMQVSDVLNNGQWVHLGYTRQANYSGIYSNYSIYINGTLALTDLCNGTITSLRYLGATNTAGSNQFNGSLDEIMFFNETLNPNQVQNIYNYSSSYFSETKSNLEETFYNYSVYTMSLNGELEKISRSFTVDMTSLGIDFVWPTPVDLVYSPNKPARINVAIGTPGQNHSVFVDLNDDLIGYWSMDYYNDTGVFDNSSYGNFGNFQGNLSLNNLSAGMRGNALDFNGEHDYFYFSKIDVSGFQEGWSAFAWINYNDNSESYTSIFGGYALDVSTGNNKLVSYDGSYKSSTGSLTEGLWTYVGVVCNNQTDTITFYINGTNDSSQSYDCDYDYGTRISVIGRQTSSRYYLNGSLDEVIIFNRTLSQEEILYLYNSTSSYFYETYSGLESGNNSYDVYAIDVAGNLEKISRSFNLDANPPGIGFVYPTPGNNLNTGEVNHALNVSITNSTNSSIWLDWNNDLVGYWSFDYVNETGIFDNSSYGRFGSFKGNLSLNNLSLGMRGNAIEFDGNANMVDFPNIQKGNNWSISAWIKYYPCEDDACSIVGQYMLEIQKSNKKLRTYNVISGLRYSDSVIPIGQWIHVVLTCRNDNLTFYQNGTYDGSFNYQCNGTDSYDFETIGSYTELGSFSWNGSIDEVMIFDRGLSDDEIHNLYNSAADYFEQSKTDLSEGNYQYSVYATDRGGNLEIISRNLTINSTSSEINFEYPTPPDNVYINNDSALINVSITNPTYTSVWIDWNDSLELYVSMDSYNNTGIFENSSNNYFGIFAGGLSLDNLTGGPRGNSLEFDGASNYLRVNNAEIKNKDNTATFTWWSYYKDTSLDYASIFSDGSQGSCVTGGNYTWIYFTSPSGSSVLTLSTCNGSNSRSLFVNNLTSCLDKWCHYALTVNYTSTTVNFYQNGNFIHSKQDLSISPNGLMFNDALRHRYLGSYGSGTHFFNGSIDEFMIFNRMLSLQEIQYLYNNSETSFTYQTPTLSDSTNYSYNIYAMDFAGNLIKLFRAFYTDFIVPGLSWIWPTPPDEVYSGDPSPIINTSLSNSTDTSVWIDWNNDLVGYWSFDYVNETGVFDNSSYNGFGILGGNLSLDNLNAGSRGQALEFNGVDSSLDVPDITFNITRENYTISFWTYKRTGSGENWNALLGSGTGDAGGYWMYHSLGAELTFYQDYYDSTSYIWQSNFNLGDEIPYDSWNHLVIQVFPVNMTHTNISVYLNGNQGYDSTIFRNSPRPTTLFQIKEIGRDTSTRHFNGSLDEVIIFNRSLSYEEIQNLYNATADYFEQAKNDLDEGTYPYSVYANDRGGNMEILSRNLTIDTTPVGISFIYPTPPDNVYKNSKDTIINVSISNSGNNSVWIDWNHSLVGYWSFDYYNETGIFDNSSYDNFAGFRGNLSLDNITTGRRGKGLEFDGHGDFIETNFNGTEYSGLSLSFWMKSNLDGEYYEYILDNSPGTKGYMVRISGGNLYSFVYDIEGNGYGDSVVIPDSDWHFYYVKINSSHIGIGIDGEPIESLVNFSLGIIGDSGSFMSIGSNVQQNSDFFNGSIDEVMIFNRTLSQEEILYLYNSTFSYFEQSYSEVHLENNSYRVYAIDSAGNLEKITRSFSIDNIAPNLSFVEPTPENDFASRNQTAIINASLSNSTDTSVWLDWNNSLVGYWSMDYVNETGIFDNSSYNHFGLFKGNLSLNNLSVGMRGNALRFNGEDSYSRILTTENLNIGVYNFTVAAWLYFENRSGSRALARHGGGYSTSSPGWTIYFVNGRPYFQFSSSFEVYKSGLVPSSTTLEENTWYHVVGVFDRYGNYTWYLNAVQDGDPINISSSQGINISPNANLFYIGSASTWGYIFNGSIDEVMIFRRALTPQEIQDLYNATSSFFNQTKENLSEQVYNYSFYVNDLGGNMEVISRNLTVDRTPPVAVFNDPTPDEGEGTDGNLQYNVTVTGENGFSAWFEDTGDLIGYWSFDYYNETGVFDNSTYNNFGEFVGGISIANLTKGKRGYGLDFDKVEGYVDVGNWEGFNLRNNNMTFSLWMKSNDTNIVRQGLLAKHVSMQYIEVRNNNTQSYLSDNIVTHTTLSSTNVADQEWHHIAFVFESGIKSYFVIDGIKKSEDSLSDMNQSINNSEPFLIGYSYGTRFFNGSIDEVMIFNRSLSLQEIQYLYNATSSQFFERSYSLSGGGYYNYSFGIVDRAGNFIRYYHGFDVDDTLPLFELVNPTPENDTYAGNILINASVTEEHLKNVTWQWNEINYTLEITDDYGLNAYSLGNISINATLIDNSTFRWEVLLRNIYLALGQSYWYQIFFKDKGGNQNSTSLRVIYGNNPPVFKFVNQYPNLSLEMDPNILINITANVTDPDSEISMVILEWKKWGDNYSLVNMQNYSGTNTSQLVFGDFTPTEEGIYTYRIFANDSYGIDNYTSEYNVSVYWDCSWTVNSSFDALAGYDENKRLGTLIMNNTGDSEYATNNCTLNFRLTYNLAEGKIYFNNYYFKDQTFLGINAGTTETIHINVSYSSEISQEDLVITTSEIQGISSNGSINTTSTLITIKEGPYLYNEITNYPISVYLTEGTFELNGYLRNLMGSSTINVTNTAYNVTYYWSLPSDFSGNATTLNYENISDSVIRNNPNIISFLDLEGMEPGLQTFTLVSTGVNNTGGAIRDASGNSQISNSVSINFLCYSVSDGLCVSSCGNSLDPDCPVETSEVIIETSTGGGGGSVGTPENLYEKSEAIIELVRGKDQEFELKIENKLASPKENIEISVSGINSEYIEIIPQVISKLNPRSSKNVKVKISAPKYFNYGKYLLSFKIKGKTVTNSTIISFTEEKYITLYIVELNKEDAINLINNSQEIIADMNKSGLKTHKLEELLIEMNSFLEDYDYGNTKSKYQELKNIYDSAIESRRVLDELNKSIENAIKRGVDVTETQKLLFIAEAAFERGDYVLALERLREAKLSYALEVKGEFNLLYEIKNNPLEALGILIGIGLFGFGSSLGTRKILYKKKIKLLEEEEKLLLELMKVVQRDCFEKNKLSMEEYQQAMYQYEEKLSETIQEKIRFEAKIANIINLKGKKNVLNQEREKIVQIMKELQSKYLKEAKVETRIYESMMKNYSSRLNEIDEKIVFLEAQESLRNQSFLRRKK